MKHALPDTTESDHIRLAAFIDGEGCLAIGRSGLTFNGAKVRRQIVVEVCNTDPRLIKWLRDTFSHWDDLPQQALTAQAPLSLARIWRKRR